MKKIPPIVIVPLIALLGLMSVYMFLSMGGESLPGPNWTTLNNQLIQDWPYIIGLVIALSVVVTVVRLRR